MAKKNTRFVSKCYHEGKHHCEHCGLEVWFSHEAKNDFLARIGVELGSPFSTRLVKCFKATCDHIVPKSRGGKNKFSNMQLLCALCNWDKGNKLESEIDKE